VEIKRQGCSSILKSRIETFLAILFKNNIFCCIIFYNIKKGYKMYKTKLVLLGLVLSTSMGFANSSCAPTELEILGVDKGKTWLKFIDNSDGDYFSFRFFQGYYTHVGAKPDVVSNIKDTKARNGKSRVIPLDLAKLPLDSEYELGIYVRNKDADILCRTYTYVTVKGNLSDSGKKKKATPSDISLLGVDKGKTWIKFTDNSDGDFFN